jgi:thiazole/oxazole-forming peptide maturase SagC family component
MQENTKSKKIILINLGAIGSDLLTSLLNLGFEEIRVFDNEKVSFLDVKLNTYGKNFLGKPRIEAAKGLYKTKKIEWYTDDISKMKNFGKFAKDSDLIVLCAESFAVDLHNFINEICFKNKKPWISARLLNNCGEIGPTVVPYRTACFKCYENRVKSNLGDFHNIDTNVKNYLNLIFGLKILSSYLSLEVLKILSNPSTAISYGNVISVNFEDYSTSVDLLLRAPNCPICSK